MNVWAWTLQNMARVTSITLAATILLPRKSRGQQRWRQSQVCPSCREWNLVHSNVVMSALGVLQMSLR
jgi:hypothetical protein